MNSNHFTTAQITQNIPDEISKNLIYYTVEHHDEDNKQQYSFNPAEITAMREEQIRQEELMRKQEYLGKNMQKYKENIRKYQMKKEIEKQQQEQEPKEKLDKIQRAKDYNLSLRKNFKNKNVVHNTTTKKQTKDNMNSYTQQPTNNKNIPRYTNKMIVSNSNINGNGVATSLDGIHGQSEILDTFSFKNVNTNQNVNQNENDIYYENEPMNENEFYTKDLRENILIQIPEGNAIQQNQMFNINNNTDNQTNPEQLQNKIAQNLQAIKNFRKSGGFFAVTSNQPTDKQIPTPTPSVYSNSINSNNYEQNLNTQSKLSQINEEPLYINNIPVVGYQNQNDKQIYSKQNNSTSNNIINNNNNNELQQRRYKKALKKLMIEQLKNKSINIPSICSCGQLQRKIDSLLHEGKSITSNDLMNVDCANNCIYYQKPGEYHRALTDIIQSIRTLKIDK
jgi:hypothetical protein